MAIMFPSKSLPQLSLPDNDCTMPFLVWQPPVKDCAFPSDQLLLVIVHELVHVVGGLAHVRPVGPILEVRRHTLQTLPNCLLD